MLPGLASRNRQEQQLGSKLIEVDEVLTCETLDSTTRPSFPILIGIMEAELAAGRRWKDGRAEIKKL
jgi:hypothetical protein